MEYLKVIIPNKKEQNIDVLINREKNGKAGQIITLGGESVILVSVDLPCAEEKEVDVCDTTPTHPMIVQIQA
jgi:hypothetical protein